MTRERSRDYPDAPAGPFPTPPRTVEDHDGRPIEYREAGSEAAPAIVQMYVDFDPADRAQGIPPSDEGRIQEWVADLVESGINVCAWDDGAVVGHAVLVPDGGDDGDAHELAIFVLQSHQGAGVGTQLIQTLLGAGVEHDVQKVWLTVEPWNHAAIHLYEKVGFEACGTGSFDREFAMRLD